MPRKVGKRAGLVIIMCSIVTIVTTLVIVQLITRARRDQPPSSTSAADPNSITILGTGDILVHPPTWKQAAADTAGTESRYDFREILAGTADDVRIADLALCHIEAPLVSGIPQDFPRFKAPPELAAAVRETGYDGCSTASNHALDQGVVGVADNVKALDDAGLGHTGTYATRAGAGVGRMYTVKDVQIGHLSYTYGLNGLTAKMWQVNVMDAQTVLRQARALRAAGAGIVVVSLHSGKEYHHQPDAIQMGWAKQLIASPDIDLILGHHAHVIQPFQKIGGKWVAYGLGNALARHDRATDDSRAGVMGKFTFSRNAAGKWVATRAEAIVTWVSLKPRIRVLSLPRVIRSLPSLDRRRRGYEETLAVQAVFLDGLQAVRDGLVIEGHVRSGAE